jgi:acyl-coenzyme A synthetase/AMP-(fatty) acid ligase
MQHPKVFEAAGVDVSADGASRIMAFVTPTPDHRLEKALAKDLRRWCKEHLDRYEVSPYIAFVEDSSRARACAVQRFKPGKIE